MCVLEKSTVALFSLLHSSSFLSRKKMSYLENQKYQRKVLRSLIESNNNSANDGIIREIKEQLKMQSRINIGEIAIKKKPKSVKRHCPTCQCIKKNGNAAAASDNRSHEKECMPGLLGARLERVAEQQREHVSDGPGDHTSNDERERETEQQWEHVSDEPGDNTSNDERVCIAPNKMAKFFCFHFYNFLHVGCFSFNMFCTLTY